MQITPLAPSSFLRESLQAAILVAEAGTLHSSVIGERRVHSEGLEGLETCVRVTARRGGKVA